MSVRFYPRKPGKKSDRNSPPSRSSPKIGQSSTGETEQLDTEIRHQDCVIYVRALRTTVSYPTKMSYLLKVTVCYEYSLDEIDQYRIYGGHVETNLFHV